MEVIWLDLFFNMGITLTHIGDNLQTRNKSKRDAKQNLVSPFVSSLTLLNSFLTYSLCRPAHLFPTLSSSFKCLSEAQQGQRANLQTIFRKMSNHKIAQTSHAPLKKYKTEQSFCCDFNFTLIAKHCHYCFTT